jgi:Tfp pilus assembly protein PilP
MQASKATPPPASAVPAAPVAAAPSPSAEPQPPSYTYVAGNRRDPFRSIIVAKSKQASMDLMHPLQQYAVRDLRLVAVLWGQLGAGAMLQTPDGKGYTVYVGTAVGNRDGVVKQIKPDQIVIKERYTDIFGERKEDSVVLDLHLPEEELK